MKITKRQLKQIIKEELSSVLGEHGSGAGIPPGMERIDPPEGIPGTEKYEYFRDKTGKVYSRENPGGGGLDYKPARLKATELYAKYKDRADLSYFNDAGDGNLAHIQDGEAEGALATLLRKDANPPEDSIIDAIETGWGHGYTEWQEREEYKRYQDEEY